MAETGGQMVAEIDILNEWIPEQMGPGTIFILKNAGENGDSEDPFWAVLACPCCGVLGLITRKQIAGFIRSSAARTLARRSFLSRTTKSCRARQADGAA